MILLLALRDVPPFVALFQDGATKTMTIRKGDIVGGISFSQVKALVDKGAARIVRSS